MLKYCIWFPSGGKSKHSLNFRKVYLFCTLILFSTAFQISCAKKNISNNSGLFHHRNNDTIVINQVINLEGNLITLKNKKLYFQEDGLITNGKIIGENISISAPDIKIFENLTLEGEWKIQNAKLEWFLGNDFKNPVKNFSVLNQFVKIKSSVLLNKMVPIGLSDGEDYSSEGRDIIINGVNKENTGLILTTKNTNQFFSYFRAPSGHNVSLKNLTLTSKDYKDGLTSDNISEYFFSGTYYQNQFNPQAKPSVDSIIIKNCNILGNIAISFNGAHSDNQTINEFGTRNKISKFYVQNCLFENANTPFVFSNMGYDSIIIKNNSITNFSESFISVPESGIDESYYEMLRKNKKYVEISNNLFENKRVVKTGDDRALSPCVIKGGYGSMFFSGNKLKNLLSSNPRADVNTMYYTCASPGKCTFSNNTVLNVLGRGGVTNPACIIKDRGAKDITMENNKVTVEKEALVKIGVLKNKNDNLSKIDGNTFLCTFIQIGNQTDFSKKMIFRNNTIKAPFINMSTEIYDIADFIFENNTIEVDYFGKSGYNISVSKDEVFFLGRQRLEKLPENSTGNFILTGNKVMVHNCGGKVFHYVHFPDGVQCGTYSKKDTYYNYDKVVLKDVLHVNNVNVGFTLPEGKSQFLSPSVFGENNSFFVQDYSSGNNSKPNAELLNSETKISSYKFSIDSAPFVLIPGSNQKLTIEKQNSDSLLLLDYFFFTSLYNLMDYNDIICDFHFSFYRDSQKSRSYDFFLVLDNKTRLFHFPEKSDRMMILDPSDISKRSQHINVNTKGPDDVNITMIPGDRHSKNAKVILSGVKGVKNFNLSLKVYNSKSKEKTIEAINKQMEVQRNED